MEIKEFYEFGSKFSSTGFTAGAEGLNKQNGKLILQRDTGILEVGFKEVEFVF